MYFQNSIGLSLEKPSVLHAKRVIDIAISSFMLLLLSPLLLAITLMIRMTSKGPVVFLQKRMGLRGEEFRMFKFRTMVNHAEKLKQNFTPEQQAEFQTNYKLKNDPRVTWFGKILRKTSLDELPQLLNVLKGEMSIVGPRPVTREELGKYDGCAELFLSVSPGITGLWQVSGRSNTTYEDRVRLDIHYVTNRSILLDLKIILSTFRVVITRIGAC